MSMSNRIQKLEDTHRIDALDAHQMTDGQLERYLATQNISTSTNDLVLSLGRLAEGRPDPWVKIAHV